MIDLYYGPTPNGQKISIMLEELSLPYTVHHVDTMAGEQFTPEFLAINPNNKQPAIVDHEGLEGEPLNLWESGAILVYLAEKTGRLLPAGGKDRVETLKWLFFQVAGIGPMGGQMAFFGYYAKEKIPLAINRYRNELNRLMGVMERHLQQQQAQGREFFAGAYSIADIAILPWWRTIRPVSEVPRPALEAWGKRLTARPAVRAGLDLGKATLRDEAIAKGQTAEMSAETYSMLYGEAQYSKHLA